MDVLVILISLALLATVGALGLGIRSMMRGGEYDRTHSTEFMGLRVGLQGLTLVLLAVALLVSAA